MIVYEKLIESPETLGDFLKSLPTLDAPWDQKFHEIFCTGCKADNCDNCQYEEYRNNPVWWLRKDAEKNIWAGRTQKEKCLTIAVKYGYEPQSRQCIEEMAELTQAINKQWRVRNSQAAKTPNIPNCFKEVEAQKHVIEEMADVQIMLWQMSYLLELTGTERGELSKVIEEKLDRQLKRIKRKEDKQV